jgi:hypothetical protein
MSDYVLFPETELAKQHSDFQIRKKNFAPAQKNQIALNATAQLELLRTIDDLQLSYQVLERKYMSKANKVPHYFLD